MRRRGLSVGADDGLAHLSTSASGEPYQSAECTPKPPVKPPAPDLWRTLPISRMPELLRIRDDHPSSVPPKQPILFQLFQQPAQIGLCDSN